MSFEKEWQVISAMVVAMRETAAIYSNLKTPPKRDVAREHLANLCRNCAYRIIGFRTTFASVMPESVSYRIRDLCNEFVKLKDLQSLADTEACVVLVCAAQAEISILLHDTQATIRSIAERAFLHLDRLLVADRLLRVKWTRAFKDEGEVGCEQLGGTHLLWHGIWAFKVHSKDSRTDLVLQTPLKTIDERSVEGAILTEWKKADGKTAAKKIKEAYAQAEQYGKGVLGATELAKTRFLILVSDIDIDPELIPEDKVHGGILYRHINIAINRRRPSLAARAQSGSSR